MNCPYCQQKMQECLDMMCDVCDFTCINPDCDVDAITETDRHIHIMVKRCVLEHIILDKK